jgi:hypothetical protein
MQPASSGCSSVNVETSDGRGDGIGLDHGLVGMDDDDDEEHDGEGDAALTVVDALLVRRSEASSSTPCCLW